MVERNVLVTKGNELVQKHGSCLYDAVSASVATTRDALLKRLGGIRSTVGIAIEIVKLCRE